MSALAKRPVMHLIVGPNGAGKTSLYETRLKPVLKSVAFINADIIQRDELGDASMEASYKAARIAAERRQAHVDAATSFITETTFSHPSKLDLIKQARGSGFLIILYHVNVRSADLSVARVEERKREGGHDVPEDKIRERYDRNQALIHIAALSADKALIYDNSALNTQHKLCIEMTNGRVEKVRDQIPGWAVNLYEQELKAFAAQ
jgi:predicted ABC-type ATPase